MSYSICETSISAPVWKIAFLTRNHIFPLPFLFHLILAFSVLTSPSFLFSSSLWPLQLNFFSNLAWRQFSPILSSSIILSVCRLVYHVLSITVNCIFLHYLWATVHHLRRPYTYVHCIHYKYLNLIKGRLSLLLSNPLTIPLMTPLPILHQCIADLYLLQSPVLVSANDVVIYPAED